MFVRACFPQTHERAAADDDSGRKTEPRGYLPRRRVVERKERLDRLLGGLPDLLDALLARDAQDLALVLEVLDDGLSGLAKGGDASAFPLLRAEARTDSFKKL